MRPTNALICTALSFALLGGAANAGGESVADDVIAAQRAKLAESTDGKGFGPQSPRDLSSVAGNNSRAFSAAPSYKEMNLCNIHFHENAEHKGGEFTKYAGNGDGKGERSVPCPVDGGAWVGDRPAAYSQHSALDTLIWTTNSHAK